MKPSTFSYKHFAGLFLSLIATAALVACGGGDGGDEKQKPTFKKLELNIAHINDHHSHLEAENIKIPLAKDANGKDIKQRVELGGFPRITKWFKNLEANGTKNLLKLHAGDAITGTPYFSFYKGEADAKLMNTVCFDAFAIGNHEFDESDKLLRDFLGDLWTKDCRTPALTANVKPALGTPLMPTSAISYLKPYTVKEVDGVKVGIVGLTISGKTQNSSQPLESTVFEDETKAAQKTIDKLQKKGIEHIVLLTHQGFEQDQMVAKQLTGVDVVVGGDSHSLIGDFSNVGFDTNGKKYPTEVTNKNGEKVCIVQAWEYTKAVGLLNVKFDERGAVESCSGQPKLLLGELLSAKRNRTTNKYDVIQNTTILNAVKSFANDTNNANIEWLENDAQAQKILEEYKEKNDLELSKAIGKAANNICLTRVPGSKDDRSKTIPKCAYAGYVAKGSDAAQVVAASFLKASKQADIALQNAGGVRIPIENDTITNRVAYKLLPFSNTLLEMKMTGQEIINALEDAVDNHIKDADRDGSHPYAAALRWDLDMSQAKGSRFSNLETKNKTTGKWEKLNKTQTYTVVTNDFIGQGRDGYTTLGKVYKEGRFVNTYLLYTQSFIDYVKAVGTVKLPLRSDYSHKSVIDKNGNAVPETAPATTPQ